MIQAFRGGDSGGNDRVQREHRNRGGGGLTRVSGCPTVAGLRRRAILSGL